MKIRNFFRGLFGHKQPKPHTKSIEQRKITSEERALRTMQPTIKEIEKGIENASSQLNRIRYPKREQKTLQELKTDFETAKKKN
jgi:broad specificity phosphatase PhoE